MPLLSPPDLDLAYTAAQKVVETHRRLVDFLRVGMTLAQIDAFVAKTLEDIQCRSAFLGYRQGRLPPFPSHACLSPNDCVVHGTAGFYTAGIKKGDILKIDIGVIHKGWIGDAAWTYAFKEQSDQARKLMDCGKESLRRGVEQLRPDKIYRDFALAVQTHAETECGFHCIRGLGGHGYGRKLHGPPYVANAVSTYDGEWPDEWKGIQPGTLIAVEPMIAVGTGMTVQHKSQWPVLTADKSLSVHYEHDVYVSETGPRVLTEGLETMPDIVDR